MFGTAVLAAEAAVVRDVLLALAGSTRGAVFVFADTVQPTPHLCTANTTPVVLRGEYRS